MQEGQLLMTQADRDRLVTLRKAKKRLITQREAAVELDLSVRQVKRLLYALKKRGDKSVVHGLRGKPSRRLDGSIAVRFGERYVKVSRCGLAGKAKAPTVKQSTSRRPSAGKRGSDWFKNFNLKKGPKV
jgi:hypothetical protein